jgi:hypothetical protein
VGERSIPRARIRAGYILPSTPGTAPRVLLRPRFGLPLELQAASTDEGRSLLRALGLDASQTVATFRALSRVLARRRYGFALGAGVAGFYVGALALFQASHGGPSFGVFFAAIAAMLVLTVARTRLDVGADGIALRWLWWRRYVGYEDIEMVTRYEKGWGRSRTSGLSVLLRSGEEVLVPIGRRGAMDDPDIAVIEERVREAMEAFRPGGVAADAALLRRGDRGLSEWVAALRALGAGANADMRTAPVPRERLFRVVEDPACAPTDRAAAAVALAGAVDEEGRARLRTIAEATAAPHLRIALQKAADASHEAEAEAALAQLEHDEEPRRART